MNVEETSRARRTDHQLLAMMDETAAWADRGERGAPLGQTASLRDAVTMALALEHARRRIIALVRSPHDSVIIFPGQIERLRAAMVDG